MSEQILNSTSAQIGYTVPFTSVHAGKYLTEESKTHITKAKHKPEKANNTKNSKQNYPGSVAFYDPRPGNEMGLFYNTPEPTQGRQVFRTEIII